MSDKSKAIEEKIEQIHKIIVEIQNILNPAKVSTQDAPDTTPTNPDHHPH